MLLYELMIMPINALNFIKFHLELSLVNLDIIYFV